MANDTLADMLAAAKAEQRRPTGCAIKHLIEELPDDDQKALQEAFDDPTIYATTIVNVLKQLGIQVAERTLQRHRRGNCACA